MAGAFSANSAGEAAIAFATPIERLLTVAGGLMKTIVKGVGVSGFRMKCLGGSSRARDPRR